MDTDLASFPLHGWRLDGSFSYGQDELYGGLPQVMVLVFCENEKATATRTLRMMEARGVKTARLAEVQHVDEKTYVYVFAEQPDFASFCERTGLNVEPSV